MLVIKDNMPVAMTATEVIKYYAKKLTAIIKDELEFERASLTEELHARTLERIFIEERIYKKIEMMKTAESVNRAVKEGFVPFKNELVHEVSDDDVDRLLKIPIRRISLFDINKNKDQVAAINARLKEIARRLKHLTDCAVEYLDSVLEEMKNYTALDPKKDPRAVDPKLMERQTTITSFSAVNAKEIVKRDIPLRYDDKGYLGTSVSAGKELIKVTPYDRILIVRKSGIWSVCDVPDKLFVDTGMWFCNYADKDVIGKILFTIIYRDPKTKFCFIKRCRIAGWIMNRDYSFVPDGMEVLHVDSRDKFKFTMRFVKKPRIKISEQEYKASSYEEKGLKANGVRLESREVESVSVEPSDNNGQGTLF